MKMKVLMTHTHPTATKVLGQREGGTPLISGCGSLVSGVVALSWSWCGVCVCAV